LIKIGKKYAKLLKKGEVIAWTLKRLGVDPEKTPVIMVGDRRHDVAGAKENGLLCAGVLFGYGSREELLEAGVDYLAESVEKLGEILSYANAGAALITLKKGAIRSMPDPEQIDELIRERGV